MKAVKDALMVYFDTDEVVVWHTKTELVLDTMGVPAFDNVKVARGGNEAIIMLHSADHVTI